MGHVFSPTSFNRYLYAGNDPVDAVDPLGTEAEEDADLAEAEAAPNKASPIVVRVKIPHATAAAKHILDLASETPQELAQIIDETAQELAGSVQNGTIPLSTEFLHIIPLNGYDLVFAGFFLDAVFLDVPTFYIRPW